MKEPAELAVLGELTGDGLWVTTDGGLLYPLLTRWPILGLPSWQHTAPRCVSRRTTLLWRRAASTGPATPLPGACVHC